MVFPNKEKRNKEKKENWSMKENLILIKPQLLNSKEIDFTMSVYMS